MHNSFDLLLDKLNCFVSANNYESALSLMKEWLDTLAVDYRLHGRVFASRELDHLCLKIGKNLLENCLKFNQEISNSLPCSAVFVASELHLAGGHTKLLEDYIKALGLSNIRILVTDPDNTVNRQAIADYFSYLDVQLEFSPKFTTLINKLEWLIQKLIVLEPKECYLFNHANDPIAIAAMQPQLVPTLIFVHHCDHTFTLGMYLNQSRHLDFRSQGFNNCTNNLNIENTLLCPLVNDDYECPSSSERFLKQGVLHTCTSGTYKFEIPYAFHLMSELPKWLKLTNGIHTHIGQLSTVAVDAIRSELNKLGIAQNKFHIIPFVKSLWQSLIDQQIDLYIDSFPMCGSRSLVEAMGAGIPAAIHHNYATPFWSNTDFAYPEAKVWKTSEELGNWLITLNKEILEMHSQFARTYYLNYHHPRLLKETLIHTSKKSIHDLNKNESNNYKTDALRAYMDLFIPIPFNSAYQQELLSKLLLVWKTVGINDLDINTYAKNNLSPYDYNLFSNLTAETNDRLKALEIINNTHSILTDLNKVDQKELTNLLYQMATVNGSQPKTKSIKIRLKTKLKLLYYRLNENFSRYLK